jgi:predicted nucleotidyltransferase
VIGRVDLSLIDGFEAEAWRELLVLAERYPDSWCLVGAQMVTLHALVHGVSRPLRTTDLDVLVDVRALSARDIANFLLSRGYALGAVSPDGVGHRFVRDRVSIDVLSIDNVGHRTDTTTVPPAHTVEVPGGRQAIARLEAVILSINDGEGVVPIPDWVGALVLKSRAAISIPERRAIHLQDVALLLALPVDIQPFLDSMTAGERRYVRQALDLVSDTTWRAVAGAVDELAGRSAAALIKATR